MTNSGGMVFQGRDNTGAAAIVNSNQEDSFIDNTFNRIMADKIAVRDRDEAEKRKREAEARKRLQEGYDPTGQAEIDAELEDRFVELENFGTEVYAQGGDPSDPNTPEGREYNKRARELKRLRMVGLGSTNYYNNVVAAAAKDGVDQAKANEWLKGYNDLKPSAGESLSDARARYINEHPDPIKKSVGVYDFVSPVLEHINYGSDANGNQSIDKKKVDMLLRRQLLTPEGKETAKAHGVNLGDPAENEKYIKDQMALLDVQFPDKPAKRTASSSSSSSSSGGSKGGTKGSYDLTHTNDSQSMNPNNTEYVNAVALKGKDGDAPSDVYAYIEEGAGERISITGVPQAILKRADGKLVLEITTSKTGGETSTSWFPLDGANERKIREYYGDGAIDALIEEGSSSGGGETKEERIAKIKAAAAGGKK